jgi:glycosyltransferase involved in cell wall biosynthesis
MKKTEQSKKKFAISKLRLAVVTDPLYKYGEFEKQLKYILRTFPQSELFVPYCDEEFVLKHFPHNKVHQSFLKNFPFKSSLRYLYPLLHPFAYKSFRLNDFDGVLSHSRFFAKFSKTGKKHIHICVTPPRFLWEKKSRMLKNYEELSFLNKLVFNIYSFLMDSFLEEFWQKRDKRAAQNVDSMITISNTVGKRIKKYYEVEADVIYPPVQVEKMQIGEDLNRRENWFLYNCDGQSSKGIELIIKACVDAASPLKIVGKEEYEERVHHLIKKLNAKGLVSFLGEVSDEVRINLMKRARALISTIRKGDFSFASVQANALGTPVVAYKSGGAEETISPSYPKTGIFYVKYNYKSLSKILRKFKDEEYDKKSCMIHAQEFDASIFMYKLKTYVEDALQDN